MAPKVVKDEYGRLFFLHNADEAWKVSEYTIGSDWGTWEPVTFSGIEFMNKTKEEPAIEEKEITITEAVIQETYNLVGNLNDLMLDNHNNWERARVFAFIADVSAAAQLFCQSIKGIEK
jgi:hypothetical protein